MYNGNDLKVGKKFIMDDMPFEIMSYAQKVMWRGGSIINIKAKNLVNGWTIAKTISDTDKFAPADIATKSYDYLYNDGVNYMFMSQESFEQVELPKEALDGAEMFLNDGDKVKLQEYNGNPINIQLDPSCALEVLETPPGEKGDTATGWKKPATLSTGLVVQVPLFINIWDIIKVDTRTKDYLSRA